MTDTQLLLPPLEGNIHESSSSFVEGGRSSAQDTSNDANGSRSVLPPEIRDRFETMKSMWRQSRRQGQEGSTSDETEVLKRKQREMAVETALAVDYEISRLQGGIAELEALLNVEDSYDDDDGVEDSCGEEDDDEGIFHDNVVAVVPPSLVPLDDDNDASNSVGSRDSIERDVKEEETDHTDRSMGPPATS